MIWDTLRDIWHRLIHAEWAQPLGLGLLLRLMLLPITWHNDALWAPWMAHLVLEGSPNVYQTLFDRFGPSVLSPVVWAPYYPLYYYLMAGWIKLLEVFHLIDVNTWLFSYTGWKVPHFPRAVYLVKLPWLIADLTVWGVVTSMVTHTKRKQFTWLYLFFPAQLWVSHVMGQNDILPVLATVAALWCAKRALQSGQFRWSLASVLSLGLGAGVKAYPILLILPTALILGETVPQIVLLTVFGVLPFTGVVMPFLRTPTFIEGVLFNQEGMSLLEMTWGIGFQKTPVFLTLYALLLAYLAFASYSRTLRSLRLAYWAVLIFLFLLSSWPFNWLVWLVPFLVWSVVEEEVPDILLGLVGGYFVILLTIWGRPVGGYTFYPLAQPLRYFTPFRELVAPYFDIGRVQHWSSALFIAAVLSMFFLALYRRFPHRSLGWSFGAWSVGLPSLLLGAFVVGSALVGSRNFAVRIQRDTSGEAIFVDSSTLVEQTFEMEIDGLCAIDIWIRAPLPANVDGLLQLTGRSDQVVIEPVELPAAALIPDAMNRFKLNRIYPAGSYTFALRWFGDVPLLLGRSSSDVLPESSLQIDGVVMGEDLAFQAIADRDWLAIGRSALSRLFGDSGFAAVWIASLMGASMLTVRWGKTRRGRS